MSNRTLRRAEQRRTAKVARKAATAVSSAIPTAEQPPIHELPSTTPQATEAQIAANRENAQKSTGPTSEIGRAAVSQNRRVHGLNYNAATFTVLPCEDQSDYDRLLQSLESNHQPQDATESLLITSMAQHRWLLDRATRLQETCLDPQTGQIADAKLFSLYLRYSTTHERAFNRCLTLLLNNRIQEQKRNIGFESEKRCAAHHSVELTLAEMEFSHRQSLIMYAERPANIAKAVEKMERRLENAA